MAKRLSYKDIHVTDICRHIYRHKVSLCTVVPTKIDSYVTFCLQSYQGLRDDRSRMY